MNLFILFSKFFSSIEYSLLGTTFQEKQIPKKAPVVTFWLSAMDGNCLGRTFYLASFHWDDLGITFYPVSFYWNGLGISFWFDALERNGQKSSFQPVPLLKFGVIAIIQNENIPRKKVLKTILN